MFVSIINIDTSIVEQNVPVLQMTFLGKFSLMTSLNLVYHFIEFYCKFQLAKVITGSHILKWRHQLTYVGQDLYGAVWRHHATIRHAWEHSKWNAYHWSTILLETDVIFDYFTLECWLSMDSQCRQQDDMTAFTSSWLTILELKLL